MYFFIFILLFFIIIIFFFPSYIKKDIVPPLSSNNYHIKHSSVGSVQADDIKTTTFQDLIILDGEGSSNEALDFGTSGADETPITYIPYYRDMNKPLAGYFDLNIVSNSANTYMFRVVDKSQVTSPGNLANYNKGWTTLNTLEPSDPGTLPVYNVTVPFSIPRLTNNLHSLTVQIGATIVPTSGASVQLSSAYLYYQTYNF